MRYKHLVAVTAAVFAAFVSIVPADAEPPRRTGRWAFEGGVGFTADPEYALITTTAVYGVRDRLQVAPTVKWAFDNGNSIIAPSLNMRYLFSNDQIVPFGELGIGFAHVDRGNSDGTELLLDPGFGVEYVLDADVSLVSAMHLNILATDSDSYFSWEVIGAQYRF